ncbi:hypothetical protein ACFYW1_08880 [Streptomyces sp. NPDC002669]|uniref:hypothetical protein n=1 Tax=Streptomyces sp. NPDC002669 TaxID=3364658 RepID=UPI003695CE3A
MSMVGLFWITGSTVHIGAPPNEPHAGVLVTGEGLTGIGEEQRGQWAWEDIRNIEVLAAPVRSTVGKTAGILLDMVITSALGGVDDGPAMFVHFETPEGKVELTTFATAPSYGAEEFGLSSALLEAFADGRATPAALFAWGRDHQDGTPQRAERERLLAEWGGGAKKA